MLRNIDRPELLIFSAPSVANDRGSRRLIYEAQQAGTVVAFLDDGRHGECQNKAAFQRVLGTDSFRDLRKGIQVVDLSTHGFLPPHPGSLSTLRKSFEVSPDGFGGSSGFGTQLQNPKREPLASRCVCFDDSREGCLAARAAGMRVVGVHPNFDYVNGLEQSCDVVFASIGDETLDNEVIIFDDLYTPGSFWLNPPSARDEFGYWCDPDTGPAISTGAAQLQEAEADKESRDLDVLAEHPVDTVASASSMEMETSVMDGILSELKESTKRPSKRPGES
eukprot:CAMPEP_0171908396 /NCGR_PEP_ID=MMETSP0993-20121228/7831_1 /TAXON_ID=483369 /ORGANISM="non described non described, Strain CCMP2098" /LENGTH=277 /DNA_ID=CAMNT_0012540977 /DNA_START=55 /DNA_END=888 /DNA_ORIENTATION=-